MTVEDVDDAVIKPMRALYPAPRHLRADEDAFEAALGAYRKALSRFERPALERGWSMAVERNELWCWPKIADLVRACDQARREADPGGRQADAWVEKASELTDAFLKRFLKSTAAVRAREGGYEQELKHYAREAAWVQAQYVLGRDDVGYSSAVLFPLGGDKEAREAFFESARSQAETGSVRVRVPKELVALWQAQARSRERQR